VPVGSLNDSDGAANLEFDGRGGGRGGVWGVAKAVSPIPAFTSGSCSVEINVVEATKGYMVVNVIRIILVCFALFVEAVALFAVINLQSILVLVLVEFEIYVEIAFLIGVPALSRGQRKGGQDARGGKAVIISPDVFKGSQCSHNRVSAAGKLLKPSG